MIAGAHEDPLEVNLLKRLGFAAFLFFLLKGLAWLLVPLAWYSLSR
jgi:hypothetical protein